MNTALKIANPPESLCPAEGEGSELPRAAVSAGRVIAAAQDILWEDCPGTDVLGRGTNKHCICKSVQHFAFCRELGGCSKDKHFLARTKGRGFPGLDVERG